MSNPNPGARRLVLCAETLTHSLPIESLTSLHLDLIQSSLSCRKTNIPHVLTKQLIIAGGAVAIDYSIRMYAIGEDG
jgi:hypothetical protein